ncbi:MAG: hypothetical protein ACTSP1_14445 [Candidatus Freyarchaeota archaeon]
MFGFSDPIETFSTIGIFVTVAVMAVFIGVYIWGTRYNKMLIRRFGVRKRRSRFTGPAASGCTVKPRRRFLSKTGRLFSSS